MIQIKFLFAVILMMAVETNCRVFYICLPLIYTNYIIFMQGAGNGCAWSGCTYSGSVCATGETGGNGRSIEHDSRKCGIFGVGRMHFCCDTDCKYQECGKACSALKMKSYPENENVICSKDFPGFGTFQGTSQFCCP